MLIVFSGLDGAGKSTQIDLMISTLKDRGLTPTYLWTRGGYTPLFNRGKALLRRISGHKALPQSGPSQQRTEAFSSSKVRRLWLLLAVLELMWVYGVQLRWWQKQGKVVICDRYLWDTLVDFRLNFPQEAIERWRLWQLLNSVTPQPDAVFLMLVPVAESMRRSDIKGEPFRDPPEVLAARLAQYQQLAQAGYWQVLDGQQSVTDLAGEIQRVLAADSRLLTHAH